MQPHFNSFPHQIQSNSSASSQQGFPPNMMQNSMQMQPQMGLMNPQMPFPLNNPNIQTMAMTMPNVQLPLTSSQPNFMNASNPFLFSQNNLLGTRQFIPMSHPNSQHNLGNPSMFPLPGQFCSLPQNASQGQFFAPNGQLSMQNMNQILPMQMSNAPSLLGHPQRFGVVNSNGVGQDVNRNQQNLVQPMITQQMNGSLSSPLKAGPNQQPQQNHNFQTSGFTRSQGNSAKHIQANGSNTNWKNVSGKNFSGNSQKGQPHRFQKSQFNHMDNGRRKFGNHSDNRVKGHRNERAAKFGQTNHMNGPKESKRSLAPTYTEQEIQQWREARKKNYPSKTNIEKRSFEKLSNSEVIDTQAKKRREQLKEVLAKQAELGIEVAEIPSHYLVDSEKQSHVSEESQKPSNKRGRFQNKHEKRGRFNRKKRSAKRQKLAKNDSSNAASSSNKRKPTLLEKLLSADIRRDKTRLLQVFRFMAMNSFFKDFPEKALEFPLVTVRESQLDKEKKDLYSGNVNDNGKRPIEKIQDIDDDDNNNDVDESDGEDDNEDNVANGRELNYCVKGEGNAEVKENVRTEEEEGEIID